MKLYSKENIHQLPWPDTIETLQAKALLVPMIEENVCRYIKNVDTRLYLLHFEENIIPITVNEKEYQNSYLTSNYFPVNYMEEKLPLKFPRLFNLQKPFVQGLGICLKGMKVNKMVMVNNWLLTTNIYPTLTEKHIEKITAFLTTEFPDHIIVFRSLNPLKGKSLIDLLKKKKYRLIGSRHIYFYDPALKESMSSKVHYHHRRDRRLFEAQGYEIVRNEEIQESDMKDLLRLYEEVYLKKHTRYSPQYTEEFLKKAIKTSYLEMIGIKKEEKIEGIMGICIRNGTMIIPFFGYEAYKEQATTLYRILTMLAIEEAEKKNVILNDGHGGSSAKKFRGMNTSPEYVAIYDRHLPLYRRCFWGLAEKVTTKVILGRSQN